jgi:GT2 family glycosyltransferase
MHTRKKPDLVGCNFSCSKAALEEINGFDESYEAPGLGEDTDIQWRLEAKGYCLKSIKFLAPLFHLYHPRSYGYSAVNEQIFLANRASNRSVCENGLRRDAV